MIAARRAALLLFVAGLATACGTAVLSDRPPTAPASVRETAVPSAAPPAGLIAFEVEVGLDGATSKNIYTVKPDGSDAQPVTQLAHGFAYHPALSGDGTRLVYGREAAHPSTPWGPSSHLISANIDGSDRAQLTSGPEYDVAPSVSTDGEWVTFVRQVANDRGAVFKMRADGSAVTRLTHPKRPESDNFPSFSPDGTEIAFDRGGAIYTVAADGTGALHRVTPEGVDAQYARWSPDGQRLLFEADGLHAINADGTGLTDLGIGGGGDWSPDGQWIAFQRYTPGTNYFALVVARADGSGAKEIWTTPPATDTFVVWVDWGPDAT